MDSGFHKADVSRDLEFVGSSFAEVETAPTLAAMALNPLRRELVTWLPEYDFGVMSHGFAPHGRDYVWIIEAGGTYRLTLTHVVELHYETRVLTGKSNPEAWDDRLTDYATAYAEGSPEGYVWGTNWSLAYPGIETPDSHPQASHWSDKTGRPMHAMSIETDRFKITAIFHECRSEKLSDDAPTLSKVLIPIK